MFNRRRHFASNPSLGGSFGGAIRLPFGLEAPAITDIVFGAAGLFVPQKIASNVMGYVPASLQGNAGVTWLVRIASVVVPGMLIRKYVNARAGYAFMIAGAAALVVDVIRAFAPSVASSIGLGYQPLLGYYPGGQIVARGGMGAYSRPAALPAQGVSPILRGAPERLNPANRF